MLKHRVIPILLFDENLQCIKPVSFGRPYRKLGPIEQYIRVLERRNVDEVIIIDIQATAQGRKPRADVIRQLTSSLYCPITYGGGISSLDDIKDCLANGADKVAIKTNYELISNAVEKFGAQAIVKVVEFHNHNTLKDLEFASVIWHNFLKAGEILLIDVMKDGAQNGPNCDVLRVLDNAVGIPIVYCGGVRDGADALEVINAGASAVAIGSAFLYTDITPKDISEYLDKNNISVRI